MGWLASSSPRIVSRVAPKTAESVATLRDASGPRCERAWSIESTKPLATSGCARPPEATMPQMPHISVAGGRRQPGAPVIGGERLDSDVARGGNRLKLIPRSAAHDKTNRGGSRGKPGIKIRKPDDLFRPWPALFQSRDDVIAGQFGAVA